MLGVGFRGLTLTGLPAKGLVFYLR
jgi:hypothetical protein